MLVAHPANGGNLGNGVVTTSPLVDGIFQHDQPGKGLMRVGGAVYVVADEIGREFATFAVAQAHRRSALTMMPPPSYCIRARDSRRSRHRRGGSACGWPTGWSSGATGAEQGSFHAKKLSHFGLQRVYSGVVAQHVVARGER